MIHDPLLKIDLLRQAVEKGHIVTVNELHEIRSDMNQAVCLFLRLQDRGALQGHANIREEIDRLLKSRGE